ncbi:S9 family peptidase [Pseudonocardia sp. MH-G8]|nr:S9 family peptidase [Pseudonocardia sp. MH-G8]
MALPDVIAVDDLLGPPERYGASISPDGTRIAYLAPWKNQFNVWIQNLDSDDEPWCVTADETRCVHDYRWTDDPRWLLYVQDDGGVENRHLHRADLYDPAAPPLDLTPFPGAQVLGLELSPARPGKAFLQLDARNAAEFDLHELDIATGELTLLAANPGHVTRWLCGGAGAPLVRAATDRGDIELSRFDPESGTLHRVALFDADDHVVDVFPFEITPDGTGVWIGSSRGSDRTRLVRVDLATGEEKEVDSHPKFDLDTRARAVPTLPSPLIRHRRTGELIGARYLGERQVIHALDPHFAEVLENLESLSDGDIAEVSSDDDGRRWVVAFAHDRDPGVTWFYDHATGESRLLFRPRPHLDPDAMAPMRPIPITARDGLALPSYLTLPVGVEPSGLPLVLMVHDGPWTRHSWGFDDAVQLWANRGYAVLQVNFRGSAGFGKAHREAAIGGFAHAMHDDLIDAVDWAVERGHADPDRIAILGGAYGGHVFANPEDRIAMFRAAARFLAQHLGGREG